MKNKFLLYLLLPCFTVLYTGTIAFSQSFKSVIPVGGNGWVNAPAKITDKGLVNWTNKQCTASIYFRVSVAQELNLALRLRVPEGASSICITINKKTTIKQIKNTDFDTISIGKVSIKQAGYVKISLKGLSKTGAVYADVTDLIIQGQKPDDDLEFVKQGSSFHFGRRGPSVHLRYTVPQNVKKEVRWFYNEITVPQGMDVIGSYFQADGFGEGYFGMQVNSAAERRVLFSVWSPFKTQDPKNIPDSMKIKLLKRGADVHAGEFGNEGSGGQSYKRFPWQASKTYAFLLGAQPDQATKRTAYTAYFKDIAANKWYLIASFSRPQTVTYLTSLYSFLENFEPDNGDQTRTAYYGNQWVSDSRGNWQEITGASYTGDATARGKYRKDYAGGLYGDKFFLKNGGFFNGFVPMDTPFTRKANGLKPVIDINSLPAN